MSAGPEEIASGSGVSRRVDLALRRGERRRLVGARRPALVRPGLALAFGLLAGLLWFGIVRRAGSLSEGTFSTEPLCHLTWGNIALLAHPRNEPLALPLAGKSDGRGGFEYRVSFRWPRYPSGAGPVPNLGYARDFGVRLEELRSLGLYFEVDAGASAPWQEATSLGIVAAELRLPGGKVLVARNPHQAKRGSLVEFWPVLGSTNASEGGELVVSTARSGALYLRGVVRPISKSRGEAALPPLGRLTIPLGAVPGQEAGTTNLFYPEGRCTYPILGSPRSRLAVLAGMHEVSEGWVETALILGGLLLGAGFLLLVLGAQMDGDGRAGWVMGGGMTLVCAGLGLPAAVFMVPMQGPDEAVHALSYGRLNADSGSLAEMFRFGSRAHWDSLRWKPDLKVSGIVPGSRDVFFLPNETISPRVIDSQVQNYDRRSPLVATLWRGAAWVIPSGPGGKTLLALRFFQVLVGAALIGLGCGCAATGLSGTGARWVVLAPVMVCAVPPMLATATNYSELAACSVFLAGTAIRQALRFDSVLWLAVLQGVAAGLILHIAHNGAAMTMGLGFWLCHRPILRMLGLARPGTGETRGDLVRWWLALALGFAAMRVFSTPLFRQELVVIAGRVLKGGWGSVLMAEPVSLWLSWCAILGTLEVWAFGGEQDGPGKGAGARLATRASWLAWPLLGSFVAVGVACLFHRAEAFADLEVPWRQFTGGPSTGCPLLTVEEMGAVIGALPLNQQLGKLLRVLATNLTPWPTDFVLMKAFWVGMLGCETRVPAWALPLSATPFVAGVILGLAGVARAAAPRRTCVVAWGVGALLFALLVLTVAYWPRNLYGRYAMPAMLTLVWAGYLGLVPLLRGLAALRAWIVPFGALVLLLFIHAAWVQALGDRFF